MHLRYEQLAAESSGTKPRPGAQWEPISESRLRRILNPTEIRVSLPGGRVIKTITCWYRAVVAPTVADLTARRVTLRSTDGICRGWGYEGLPFSVLTATDQDNNLVLELRGPGVRCEETIWHFHELPRLERRIHRLCLKQNLFDRILH